MLSIAGSFCLFTSFELEETEQQLKINAHVRNQKHLDIERLKLQQSITEQMVSIHLHSIIELATVKNDHIQIKAREQERLDRLKEQEILAEIGRQREALTSAFKKEMAAFQEHEKQMEKYKDS